MPGRWSFTPRWQFMQLLISALCCLLGVLVIYKPGSHGMFTYSNKSSPTYTFPHAGKQIFPTYRIVALYGEPDTPVLGALGEQPLDGSIARVKDMARQYDTTGGTSVLPAFEIIATIASDSPMADGTYSRPADTKVLATWISHARQSGVYVILDLQPGRSNFLAQAKWLAPLLCQPNVGLALDPEWRLGPDQVPLEQIGTVSTAEINETSAWLASLVRQRHLPQKLLLLHEFRPSMITDLTELNTSHPELAYAIQMDGQGSQADKLRSWQTITSDRPTANMYFGWKNFFNKDTPMRSPQETLRLIPQPQYVSYQ
jgi:hypothetical protein